MRCAAVALGALVLMACGGAQPPAGPAHDPSGSKEAATRCPDERKQAQEAREMLLDSSDPAQREATAKSVFAEAQCEALALESLAVPAGSHDSILADLRTLRGHVQDADNLYLEVLRYEAPSWHGQALLGRSQAKRIYADIVAAIVPPGELDAPARLEFESELRQALEILRADSEELRAMGCAAMVEADQQDSRCR